MIRSYVGGVYHTSQAPDEIIFLAGEIKDLAEKSGLHEPAIRKILKMN
jgi:hypothetical protein